MATKADVANYIKNNYNYEVIDGDVLKLTFEDAGRTQLVFAFIGDAVLETWSPFARVDQISAAQAFNANQTVFGIAIFAGNFYCLKQASPIENIDANEIAVAFEILSSTADEIERNLGLGDNL